MAFAHRPALALLALALLAPELPAQQPATLALSSYERARAVLDHALAAHGGADRLRSIGRILIRYDGFSLWRNQSRRVAPPYDATPNEGSLVFDYAGKRLLWESATEFPGGFKNRSRLVVTPAGAWSANLIERRWTTVPGTSFDQQRNLLRRLPQYHLLSADERAATLRWLGEATWRTRRQDVITYAAVDGLQGTLFIDRERGTLTKVEQVFADPLTGDALAETLFDDYRSVAGLLVPGRRILRQAGETVEDIRYRDVLIDPDLPDTLFQRPADFVDGSTPAGSDTALTRLGAGVYLVPLANGNNSLLVEFRDFLVVIEAYGNDADSRRAIARIHAAVPGKPIRYLVPTHHHDDHTGGLRTYIAEGATILTTAGNRKFVERMSQGIWTVSPDRLAQQPAPLRLELLRGPHHVLTDGEQTLELQDIGPTPHVDEMLVAWLPREQLLFQGDLFNRPADGHQRAGNPTTRYFAEWIARSGLNVARIAGVHGPPGTVAELRQAVALMPTE